MNFYLLFKSINIKTIKDHGIWWTIFIVHEMSIYYYSNGQIIGIWNHLMYYAINIGLFYSHLAILDDTIKGIIKKYNKMVLLISAELLFFLLIKIGFDIANTDFQKSPVDKWHMIRIMGVLDLYRSIFFMGLSSLYWTASNISNFERKTKDAEIKQLTTSRDNLALEASLARSQNALLRQQINPHLLFNSLNFIHNTVYKVSREAAENVILLADIMRFSVAEAGADGKVLLNDEIDQIRNLIKINQVRFDAISNIAFNISGVTTGFTIIPLVLITLVENIFKHGHLSGEETIIDLQVSADGEMRLYTRNKIKNKAPYPRLKSTGLDNIRIRLDYAYGKNYSLALAEKNNYFKSELIIKL